MLIYKQTHLMLCWLSIAAQFVLPQPQPLGCSQPGSDVVSWRYWMVTAPPFLVGSSGVHRDWISGSPASPPLCAWDLQMQVRFWTEGAVPCGAGGRVDGGAAVPSILTDRRSYHFFILFVFIYVCYTLLSVLGYPERRYINWIYYYYYYYC